MRQSTNLWNMGLAVTLLIGLASAVDTAPAKPNSGVAGVSLPKSSNSSKERLRGKVLFLRDEALWCANLDGTGQRTVLSQIFNSKTGKKPLALSPDGTRLLYSHNLRNLDEFTGDDLFSIRLDGTAQRRLTNTAYMLYSRNPRFSPNGQQIVYSRFTGYRMGGPGYTDAEVRIMERDGSNDRPLVGDLSTPDQNHFDAFWSIDGRNILFTRTVGSIDYSSEGSVKFDQRIIGVDGENERDFSDEWNEYGSILSPVDKTRLAAKVAEGATIGSVLRSKDGKLIVFEVSQQHKIENADGLIYNEISKEIWRSDSNGSNVGRVTSANSDLVGWFR